MAWPLLGRRIGIGGLAGMDVDQQATRKAIRKAASLLHAPMRNIGIETS